MALKLPLVTTREQKYCGRGYNVILGVHEVYSFQKKFNYWLFFFYES